MFIKFISLLLTMAEFLFLFLKGMTGALAPFSYLVLVDPLKQAGVEGVTESHGDLTQTG
jgi:hypothetical protein